MTPGSLPLRLPPLPSVREIIRLYKLRARKQLSQNFLLDANISRKIVRSAGNLAGADVCEVGPGPGGLTRCILQEGARQLTVIEKDPRFMPSLQLLNDASGGRMRIFQGDVLRFDMSTLFPDELSRAWADDRPPIYIVGNLPFNVSTPLIISWLRSISERSGAWRYGRVPLTLTFQREVAERLVAPPGHRQRCRLSVMAQSKCYVHHKFNIGGSSFVPPPDVDVGVVRFVPLKQPHLQLPFDLIEKVVRHVFHFRPKKCKRGIETLFPPDRPDMTAMMIQKSDVCPETRPYCLTMEEIDRLCHAYKHICDDNDRLFEYDYRSSENAAAWRKMKLPLTI